MKLRFKGQKTKSNTAVPIENHDIREKQILYLRDPQFSEEDKIFYGTLYILSWHAKNKFCSYDSNGFTGILA